MPQNCLYCENKAALDALMIKIADLTVSTLYLFILRCRIAHYSPSPVDPKVKTQLQVSHKHRTQTAKKVIFENKTFIFRAKIIR